MGALDGLLVATFEQAVAAPLCTLRLADGGARVIKIERAEGDPARHYDDAVAGTSAYFAWLNRGKESVVLDVKTGADRATLDNILARADIFVQNFAPGAAARLGLDAKALIAKYPRLIAVDIAGYGSDTTYADMRAYDMLVQAESGICAVTGTPDTPVKVGVSIADIGTGMNAHAAILEALLERAQTGRGKAIEMAMFDSMAEWMTVPLLHYMQAGKVTPRVGLSHAVIQPYSLYDCADGQVVIAIQNQAEWRRFCDGVLEKPALADDVRFVTNPLRLKNRAALDVEIFAVLGKLNRDAAVARLERATVAWGRVSTVQDVAQHPGLRLVTVDVPGGTFQCMAPPLQPNLPRRSVPALGQHSAAIRAEFAG